MKSKNKTREIRSGIHRSSNGVYLEIDLGDSHYALLEEYDWASVTNLFCDEYRYCAVSKEVVSILDGSLLSQRIKNTENPIEYRNGNSLDMRFKNLHEIVPARHDGTLSKFI